MGMATLNGRPFRLDPTSISWPFNAKTNVVNTLGGKVVQVFGVTLGDITVSGAFGSKGGGWKEQVAFLNYLTSLTPSNLNITADTGAATLVRFIYPPKNWDFNVYLKSFVQTGSSVSVEQTNQTFNPKWTLTFFPNQDLTKFQTEAVNTTIDHITVGLGWSATEYQYAGNNVPLFETLATEKQYADQVAAINAAGGYHPPGTGGGSTASGGAPAGGGGAVTAADPNMTILGPSSRTAAQISAWYHGHGYGGNTTAPIDQVIGWYVSEGAAQNVRGDVAFAQACLETGYFTNQDTARNNFAGIGHYNSAPSGLDFVDALTGVRAQIQLLYVIATGSYSFAFPRVCPGWGGKPATTWAGLSGNWATDTGYANSIMTIYGSMLAG